jgi:hypothetical protein
VHLASAFYDVEGFRTGAVGSTLRSFEAAEAGDVRGKRLGHLQCHIGLATLSWARRGAVVSGLNRTRCGRTGRGDAGSRAEAVRYLVAR